MRFLIILNEAPYGSERCYNGLRLAHALNKENPDNVVTVFLMADAVTAARRGQKTPEGFYNVEVMLKRALRGAGRILLCGMCMEARGLTDQDVIEGATRSTMAELATETAAADKVLVF